MRSLLAVLAAAGGFAFVSADAEACSARGTHCGHPGWAANAFEGPRGSQAKGIVNLNHEAYRQYYRNRAYGYGYGYAPSYGYKKVYKKKHYKKHY
jgi:hypothetical protein